MQYHSVGGEVTTLDLSFAGTGETRVISVESITYKYINGKLAQEYGATWGGVTVGDGYLDVEFNYSENTGSSRSTTLIFDQDGSGNKINLTVTQEPAPEYWEIRFNPIPLYGIDTSGAFDVTTNISGEGGCMYYDGTLYRNWIVNQNRHTINVYISSLYPGPGNSEMLSWSCLDKNGNAFSPNYNIPDNQYLTTKTTGLGSYTLTKISTPPVDNDTPILSSRFNPTKKYPLDLNFYWWKKDPV